MGQLIGIVAGGAVAILTGLIVVLAVVSVLCKLGL